MTTSRNEIELVQTSLKGQPEAFEQFAVRYQKAEQSVTLEGPQGVEDLVLLREKMTILMIPAKQANLLL